MTRCCIRKGFTLIEMLLVLAIIGVITAITLPSFVKSIKGNRLRAATRTIVMSGRYARSMAILNQDDMGVSINLDDGIVQVCKISEVSFAQADDSEGLLRDNSQSMNDSELSEQLQGSVAVELSRKLDRVKVLSVVFDQRDMKVEDGRCFAVYDTNGTCSPYSVTIEDEDGHSVLVKVDSLGSTKTKRIDG